MPYLDYDAIKQDVSMDEVLALLDWKPVWQSGGQRRGKCPFHVSNNPRSRSFCVFAQGWYCHTCKMGGDQLRLFAEYVRMPVYAATRRLCETVGAPVRYTQDRIRFEEIRNGEEER